jgi:tail tube protein gp19|uniref:Tail tube protein n=1 Tax=Myoviridae sp. ctCo31 TaxID=2825053 RepID=A0A8S5ULS5_9CAUD|nr:MAG TPA: tail tube protein [Myoviridae sp. ctCo31]
MALSVTDITKAFSSGDVARSNLFKVKIPFLGRETEFKIKAS